MIVGQVGREVEERTKGLVMKEPPSPKWWKLADDLQHRACRTESVI